MGIVIGIDIGGSTTKIAGFRGRDPFPPQMVTSSDPVSSLFGAFGKFTYDNKIPTSAIERIVITGVGAAAVDSPIFGAPTYRAAEFDCIGYGALYLSSLEKAVIASMGTGTALVYADGKKIEYLGGTGVGGGTLVGLSNYMLGMNHVGNIMHLAQTGSAEQVDLTIGDVMQGSSLPQLPADFTASNFGKISETASQSDIAMGIFNLVAQVVGMFCVFASRMVHDSNVVLTGNLSKAEIMHPIFDAMAKQFRVNFIIPENSGYATALGAALCFDKGAKLEQILSHS